MLLLDKTRTLDRMLWLSQRQANAVPSEYLLSAPLRWTATPDGRRTLAGEVVLRPSVLTDTPVTVTSTATASAR